jgi:hypothetical protein
MTDGSDVIKGQVVSQEEKAEFDSLRAVFDPKAALDRLDSYGKWLFASAAVVGSLGAGLSNSAFSKLRGVGVWLFAFAILALGLSLVAASRSIAPHWINALINNLASLRGAVEKQFKTRQRQLAMAAGSFAFALVLAALSPLASLVGNNTVPIVHYSLDEKGTFDAGLEANGLSPGTMIELRLETRAGATVILPKAAATADQNGQLKVTLRISNFGSSPATLDLVSCAKTPPQVACTEQQRLSVRP